MSDSANAGMKAMQTPTRTEAEAMAQRCPWKVGRWYYTYSRVSKVLILSISLRGNQPIAGAMRSVDPDDIDLTGDSVWKWGWNGSFRTDGLTGSSNDLTTHEATP